MSDDRGKLAAALAALDEIGAGWIVGVGTGSTTNLFIDALAGMRGHLGGAVASSVATARRLAAAGVRVLELNDVGRLPLYVDGADEATRRRELIKGGGGALTREKIVAAASERFVCIVDRSKLVERLGRFPLPVEIIAMAERHVTAELERLGGRAVRRPGFSSDNGNPILDVHGLSMEDPAELEARIETVAGVVCAGLFCRRPADLLIVGDQSGAERL